MAIVPRMPWRGRDERGVIYFIGGMMLLVPITLIGVMMFSAALVETNMATGDTRQTQTFYIAEAGMNVALRELADGDTVNDFDSITATPTALFTNKPLNGGSFTVQAVNSSGSNVVTVTVTGCVPTVISGSCPTGNVQSTLRSQATKTFSITGQGPFFAVDTFSIQSNELVDSFDSGQCAASELSGGTCYQNHKCQALGCGADIRVNGTGAGSSTDVVSIGGGTPVYGNVSASRGRIHLNGTAVTPSCGTTVVCGNATYDATIGSCTNCDATHVKGTISSGGATTATVPNVETAQACGTPYTFSTAAYVTSHGIPAGDYNASTGNLTVNSHADTIQSGTFCFHAVTVSGGSGAVNIVASSIAPVIIYVNSTVTFSGGASFNNNTDKAENLQILSIYTGATNGAVLSSSGNAYGLVYAPQTQIVVSGSGDWYGAVLGKDISITGSAKLHYDKALANSGKLKGGTAAYTAGSWTACKNPQCT